MSIESEIERLNNAKSDLAAAIEEYGVSVASDATLDEYPDMIRSIAIPTELPSPEALTFTGAVQAQYDGSAAVSVDIPLPIGAVKLWSGSWSTTQGNTLVVASGGDSGCTGFGNISDFEYLYCCVSDTFPYFLRNNGTAVVGGGVIFSQPEHNANSKVGCIVRAIRMSLSGDTLTAQYHSSIKSTSTEDTSSTLPITAIYGIPVKEA